MTTYRIIDDGRRRGLDDGSVRAVDEAGSAWSFITGSTSLSFTATVAVVGHAAIVATAVGIAFAIAATPSAAAVLTGDVPITFAATANPSVAGQTANTSFAFSQTANPSGSAAAQGNAALAFTATATPVGIAALQASAPVTFTAQADPVGYVRTTGSSSLFFTATANPHGSGSAQGNSPFTFATTANPSGTASATLAPVALTFSATGSPQSSAPVTGATAFGFSQAATIIGFARTTASTSMTWAASAQISVNHAAKFRNFWLDAYAKRQKVLNAIDNNNRFLAKAAGTQATATADALVITNTNVTNVDNRVTAEANRTTLLTATVGTKTTTFAQIAAPPITGRVVGDTWIDTDDGNKLYTWDGTAWAARALTAGITVFAQITAPTSVGRIVGDLWFDTDDSNKPYRWDGAAWVEITDQRILANATGLTNLTTRVTSTENTNTAQANSITSLNSTVYDATSGVAASATAVSSLNTRANTTDGKIGTLEASWTVALDVNGYVSGVRSVNTGSSATFTVLADKFQIVTPGQTPKVPFAVASGNVYINTDLHMGAGRIVSQNGAYMKVQGTGFGTTNQFLEWYGPTRAINLCDEAGAIQYLKVNGSAYFGGTLSAGLLKNAVTSSTVSNTATVETGIFGTNGGAKTVVCSLSYNNSGWVAGNVVGTWNNITSTATVTLSRRYAGGAWTVIGTINATGISSASYDDELARTYVGPTPCSGSITVTDNQVGTGTFEYRAVISAPTGLFTNILNGSPGTQTLTIISTEG